MLQLCTLIIRLMGLHRSSIRWLEASSSASLNTLDSCCLVTPQPSSPFSQSGSRVHRSAAGQAFSALDPNLVP